MDVLATFEACADVIAKKYGDASNGDPCSQLGAAVTLTSMVMSQQQHEEEQERRKDHTNKLGKE